MTYFACLLLLLLCYWVNLVGPFKWLPPRVLTYLNVFSGDVIAAAAETVHGSGKGSSYHPSINDKCKLVNWNGNRQVVAKGFISAIDPNATVHGAVLGTKCYRIAIEEVLDDSVRFYRYEPEFTNLGDAHGSTIAWPISCIVFED